ncbi:MAG: hypothetical protein MUO22_04055, partial [Sedimentisphaerales bacterium]|nr:hypothetical protein [Sedimentisphaerales bacterium]
IIVYPSIASRFVFNYLKKLQSTMHSESSVLKSIRRNNIANFFLEAVSIYSLLDVTTSTI